MADNPLTMAQLRQEARNWFANWAEDHQDDLDAKARGERRDLYDLRFEQAAREQAHELVPVHTDTMLQVLASDPGLWFDQDELGLDTIATIFHSLVEDKLIGEIFDQLEEWLERRHDELAENGEIPG